MWWGSLRVCIWTCPFTFQLARVNRTPIIGISMKNAPWRERVARTRTEWVEPASATKGIRMFAHAHKANGYVYCIELSPKWGSQAQLRASVYLRSVNGICRRLAGTIGKRLLLCACRCGTAVSKLQFIRSNDCSWTIANEEELCLPGGRQTRDRMNGCVCTLSLCNSQSCYFLHCRVGRERCLTISVKCINTHLLDISLVHNGHR